jgi:hypothetical protein
MDLSANPLTLDNYFVGTNSQARNVEEAYFRHIIADDEILLGIFDGIFFEEDGTRVGGIALNDFLIITDKRVTLWARDQLKDVVDSFPLTHVAVGEHAAKDALHGWLKLLLVLPNVSEEAVAQAEPVGVIFDLIPLADLNLVVGMLEVLSALNREMSAARASVDERAKTTLIIFQQTFVNTIPATAKVTPHQPPVTNRRPQSEPLMSELDEDNLMTPLSRLDALDGFNAKPKNPVALPPPVTENPVRGAGRQPRFTNSYEDARFYQAGDEPPSQPKAHNGYVANELENELNWLKQETNQRRSSRHELRQPAHTDFPMPPAAPRVNGEFNPDSVYTVGRIGRAAFDAIAKMRKENEARAMELLPQLNPFKEGGLSVREMTDLLTAVNGLMDTLNRNPAAREIALTFLNRAFPGGGKLEKKAVKKDEPPSLDDLDEGEELPVVDTQKTKLKVERRNNNGNPPLDFMANPVRQKVSIKRTNPAEEAALLEETAGVVVEEEPRRAPHRIMVRSAAPVEEEPVLEVEIPENFPAPEVPLDTITILSESEQVNEPIFEKVELEFELPAEEVGINRGRRKIGVRNV